MQTNFQLASVMGMLYTGGNICFSPDGATLYSPVQNYITAIQLRGDGNRSYQAANCSIQCFDVTADGQLMIVIGTRGLGFFYSLASRTVIETISFPPQCSVECVKFSPCARFVAVALESTLQVYNAPTSRVVAFHGCHRIENIHNALTLPITHIDWTADSCHVLLCGQDARMRIYPRDARNEKGKAQMHNNLVGHRAAVLRAWFLDDRCADVISISADNVAIRWHRTPVTRKEVLQAIAVANAQAKVDRLVPAESEEAEGEGVAPSFLEKERIKELMASGVKVSTAVDDHLPDILRYAFEVKEKHLLQHKGNVSVAAFHRPRQLVAIGYSSGIYAVHSAGSASFDLVHLLSVSAQSLTACAFSPGGDWIAFGSAHLKQLVVWDWKAETFLLKEQSHYYDIACTAVTSDGSAIISGGEDGKVKVWNSSTGQCFVTFIDHQAGITGIATSAATNAFFTSSKDGTARGFDLVRYRPFRVFSNPDKATQYSSVAVDPSGEILAVGSSMQNCITLFSVQTGRIVDELSGHEGPVATLAFHPSGTVLASGGLDKSLILWDVFNTGEGGDRLKGIGEALQQTSEVLCVAFSHSGKRMAILALNQEISIYDTTAPAEPELVSNFSTAFDAAGGWNSKNVGPNSANANAHFTVIAFSPDGDKIVAGGESKWICLYHALQGFVLKRWAVTTNLDVQGAEEQYQWRTATEAGSLVDIDVEDDDAHLKRRKLIEMPGSRHRHFSTGKRKTELTARTMHISFAGHGSEFVCATTDGLLVFSLNVAHPKFTPLQLTEDITEASVRKKLREGQYVLALIGALLLGDEALGKEVMRTMPSKTVPVACSSVPTVAFPSLVIWVSHEINTSKCMEQALLWTKSVLIHANEPLTGHSRDTVRTIPAMKELHKSLQRHKIVEALAQENYFSLSYLIENASMKHETVLRNEAPEATNAGVSVS